MHNIIPPATRAFFLSVTLLPHASMLSEEPTQSPLWCKHTVLAYVTPGGAQLDFWSKDHFKWLAAYCDAKGELQELFFDGYLLIGFGCKGGRHLLPLRHRKPAVRSDWEAAVANYLTVTEKLSEAYEDVAKQLRKPEAAGKVILAMPYPDRRQKSFGPVAGRTLDLSKEPDRLTALKWYIDEAIRQWQKREQQGSLTRVKLVGFYWGHESISKTDAELVKGTAAYVHGKGCLMHWIPCFGGARRDWRALGLDCLTQQINYQNPQKPGRPLTIFDDKTRTVREYRLHGVEMTPMARARLLNPRIWTWHQVYLANLEAALRLKWHEFPAMTYFHGNDLAKTAADPKSRIFYDMLHDWTKGELTWDDLERLSIVVLDELRSRECIDDAIHQKIASAKTVLERLRLMEEPKLAAARKALAERLASHTVSSGNLLTDGSFEDGTGDWPTRSRGVSRTEERAHAGRWSLQLTLEPAGGSDIVRAYVKSKRATVQPGQLVRLTAWANVPDDLKYTDRGLLIGLSRFHKGKMIATWTECEVRQTKATNGWQQLTAYLFVDDRPCDEVQAIVGLCGSGTAYVDAAELVTLSKPQ